ncbi:hypothetical protein A0J51_01517 [Gluconobacter japonicus]|uniref:Uncharacterized protein n=1 Tax=Gluconobacter japonicus TaxID=376620 RepID=A0A9Q2IQS6_GLUJA|nr:MULTISPECIES: YdaS family helix-turn-helix protein [Gluconobacter]MBF0869748.1 hypothetical protein [Gluconobacter japonicus]MBS0982170.1 helix-turn-helix domain-containing protein [Gluconobacter cerinus]OAG72905.1 hypothetical protein A0J51_01517 [Gluconobacter japonicus]
MCTEILSQIRSRRFAVKEIAAACNVTTQAVSQWEKVPRKHLGPVSRVTGIDAHQLRPDLFSDENKAA